MICTFFGHRDAPQSIQIQLNKTIIDLIENHDVTEFYVGNQGVFDRIVTSTLKKTKIIYPQIKYTVVLAYLPKTDSEYNDYLNTLYPDGLEKVPFKYAISERNKWMINKSDYVVTYVNHISGGSMKFKELAEKKGKTVINIADIL